MKISNRITLYIILLVAICLRVYNYSSIPFTHDEFSALFRLNATGFSELIQNGVMVDAHPAGIQVFMYYWSQLFGAEEWVMKLPFTVFGLLSVFLIFLIGKKWYNETVGLISAAFMASIQFAVMYSQIARPYISGLFFTLLMVYYWSNLVKEPDKKFIKNAVLFVVSATLCVYNHHFSLLFAAIVGLSGLFFIPKKYLLKYIGLGLAIFILYIPHINIFFHQLSIGGVEGWLAKPKNDFILEFIHYIFNFSNLSLLLVFVIVGLGAIQAKFSKSELKSKMLFACWFLLPFLIGFYYSIYVNAVLQYSVLIFSFSFLFFLLFGHIKLQNEKINLIVVLAILLVNCYSLIDGRKHYEVFYTSVYQQILADYEERDDTQENPLLIIDSNKKITDYYSAKEETKTNWVSFDSFANIQEFQSFLDNESKTHQELYFGCVSFNNPLTVAIIQDYFPNMVWQKNYFGGTTYLFNKQGEILSDVIANLDFESEIDTAWTSIKMENISISTTSSDRISYRLDSTMEYGPTYSKKLSEIISNENNFIDVSLNVYGLQLPDLVLVASLESGGENIHWSGSNFNQFLSSDSTMEWRRFHHSIKLSDVDQDYDDILLKVFIWNKGKANLEIDDFKILKREGNPIIYSFNEKLD